MFASQSFWEEAMAEELIGTVDHYFGHIGVAGIALTGGLRIGDKIRVVGHTTDFELTVESMQVEHESVGEASPGTSIGVKAPQRCREGDQVFRLN
jgi:selenocysteine-specific translation elongation factor